MALVKCKTCGDTVAKSADTCPHCGAKLKRTPLGCGTLIAILIVGGIAASFFDSGEPPSKRIAAPVPERTPEQKAADKAFGDAQVYARMAMDAIRKAARNPDSVQVASALVMAETGAVCIKYRGQNGFGGMSIEDAIITKDGIFHGNGAPNLTKLWASQCAGRTGQDISFLID